MTEVGGPGTQDAVRSILDDAIAAYADDERVTAQLRRHLDRADEPLRVAIAGKMKAGKSTLINALVGEEIAPTDAGECTRVVTWYRYASTPQVVMYSTDGLHQTLPVHRVDGRLQLRLGGRRAAEVERLVVDWPAQNLQSSALIDTPGIDSTTTAVSQRSTDFLTPDDEPSDADAIVYLLRHLHSTDVRFLESFRDRAAGRAAMINTVGVLSRSDEIGAGRLDALISAQRVARRYSDDKTMRQLCQTVVPVAGLLAKTGRTLRHDEFLALQTLADCPRDVVESLMISVDRFIRSDPRVAVEPDVRARLLDRLGVFGVRLSITMIRAGLRDTDSLARDLVRRSGLDELRRLLAVQFTQRSDLLKARSALLAVEQIVREQPRSGTEAITTAVERVLAGAHEFRELKLLTVLRGGTVQLATSSRVDAERLLGGSGTSSEARVGLEPGVETTEIRTAALDALAQWRERAESPMTDRVTASACRIVTRSCEGVLADIA